MITTSDINQSFIYCKDNKDNKDKHSILTKYQKALKYQFDYERNKFFESKTGIYNLKTKSEGIDYQNLSDSFPDSFVKKNFLTKPQEEPLINKLKNIIRTCVSECRIRYIDKEFNLDLVYITQRVVAMGFPAFSFPETFYRNEINKVNDFISKNLTGGKVKVYNLCLEPKRIYDKSILPNCEVALYPISDHCCCPVQMMLEFCADACNFLLNSKNSSLLVHCKAGKGRTGSMICAYLIFCGLANSSKEAMDLYAERRSRRLKGVTVASQRRYLQHFETFLNLTFQKPFYKQIPKIFRMYSTENSKNNLLYSIFINEANEYYKYGNSFRIRKIKIGPFKYPKDLDVKIYSFNKHILFSTSKPKESINFRVVKKKEEIFFDGKWTTSYYSIIYFLTSDALEIESDTEVRVSGGSCDFFIWINLFYITLEKFLDYIGRIIQEDIIQCKKTKGSVSTEEERRKISDKNLPIALPLSDPLSGSSRLLINKNKHFCISKFDEYFDIKPNKKEFGFMKEQSTMSRTELYSKIKKYLEYNTTFLKTDFIQASNLNSIFNFLIDKSTGLLNQEKNFKFTVNSSNFDKYYGELNSDLALELTYCLNDKK